MGHSSRSVSFVIDAAGPEAVSGSPASSLVVVDIDGHHARAATVKCRKLPGPSTDPEKQKNISAKITVSAEIWEAAIFEPGMHFLKIVPNDDQGHVLARVIQGSRRFLLVRAHLAPIFPNPKADNSHYVALAKVLDTLSNTCSEAKRVVQRLLRDPRTLEVNGQPIALTSHAQDIVCLDYLPSDLFYSGCRISHDFQCPGLDKIRHLAVRYCHKWETVVLLCEACGGSHMRETTKNHPIHAYQFLARHCPNLETFYLIDYLILRKEANEAAGQLSNLDRKPVTGISPDGQVVPPVQSIPTRKAYQESPKFTSSGRTYFEIARDQDDWLVQSRVFETLDWIQKSFRRYAVESTTTRHRHSRPLQVQFKVLSCEWDVVQATAAPRPKIDAPRKGNNKRMFAGDATEPARKSARSTRNQPMASAPVPCSQRAGFVFGQGEHHDFVFGRGGRRGQ
ncbi:uncharacterized protein VDAG_07613 [Verticillium dahliae VdLs.17]|uniref:Uncharacterized protein n=1 Tax=Verticillium dahliae (strain VdLs.17 / ATCC MYA-4575 / FGSC 10137) TaxID=498257 RepID=G2XC35_VERDV|nr:uncharacterized protein VDAG_07613 [Verticillium dahliae VdLs.17]EGY16449.1 hypothetical protein VDAG_07613 [Verticillium dahliae VdLs.17]KAH6699260.1 hypothetical protein EV126DRAFT_342624 [Verticillium dahliae]